MIREAIDKIMREYPEYSAKRRPLKKDGCAAWMRDELPQVFHKTFPRYPNLIWEASPGKGRWADTPWIAARDSRVAERFTEGYCVAYIFTTYLDAVYLSFQLGVDVLKDEFGGSAEEILSRRVKLFREKLKRDCPARFSTEINLQHEKRSSRSAWYERAHVLGIRYERRNLPTENKLNEDLIAMLELYHIAIKRVGKFEKGS